MFDKPLTAIPYSCDFGVGFQAHSESVWVARITRNPNDFQWVFRRIRFPLLKNSPALQFGRQLRTLEMYISRWFSKVSVIIPRHPAGFHMGDVFPVSDAASGKLCFSQVPFFDGATSPRNHTFKTSTINQVLIFKTRNKVKSVIFRKIKMSTVIAVSSKYHAQNQRN